MTPVAGKIGWLILTLTTTPVATNHDYTQSKWVSVEKETYASKAECVTELRKFYPKNITHITDKLPENTPTKMCIHSSKAHYFTDAKMIAIITPVKPVPQVVKPQPPTVKPDAAAKKAEQEELQRELKILREAFQQQTTKQLEVPQVVTPMVEVKMHSVQPTTTKPVNSKVGTTHQLEKPVDLKTNYHKP